MLIDLHALLSQEGKVKKLETELEMDKFISRLGSFPITKKEPMSFVFTNVGGGKVMIEADIDIVLNIPCDRCLEDVRTQLKIQTSREVDLSDSLSEEERALDETDFISGTDFDAEKFAHGEILVNLPMKVLCSESCKGICNRCGTNLNHGSCGCDTTELDPRMAKALEVFNSFKEV